MKKTTVVLGLISVFTLVSCNNTANGEVNELPSSEQVNQKVNNINVNQFSELISKQKGNIVDVRTPEEWTDGTVEGAQKINFYDANFAANIQQLDPNTPIYIYCKSGGRSAQAAQQAKEMGFTKVYNITGGFDAWKKAEKPIVK